MLLTAGAAALLPAIAERPAQALSCPGQYSVPPRAALPLFLLPQLLPSITPSNSSTPHPAPRPLLHAGLSGYALSKCLKEARQQREAAGEDVEEQRLRARQYEQPGELVTLPSGARAQAPQLPGTYADRRRLDICTAALRRHPVPRD
jgi:hypothetical protein